MISVRRAETDADLEAWRHTILKRMAIAWAAENGVREIYTWTQRGNDGMRAVNEKLGYVTCSVAIRVRGPLPLPS